MEFSDFKDEYFLLVCSLLYASMMQQLF